MLVFKLVIEYYILYNNNNNNRQHPMHNMNNILFRAEVSFIREQPGGLLEGSADAILINYNYLSVISGPTHFDDYEIIILDFYEITTV